MVDLTNREIGGIIEKIKRNMQLYKNATPHISDTLKYSKNLSPDGNWTGSFWMGMVIMAGAYKGGEEYIDYIDSFYNFYNERLENGYKDHDLGFLYQLYAVDAYRLSNKDKYRRMAIRAAQLLMCRYNRAGGYIRAWSPLICPENDGRIIMDCLLNLPLLFCASQMSGLDYLRNGAISHAKAALNCLRADNSVFHTYHFDTVTGEPLYGTNEGGYNDGSCWSRGLAWGVYGFYLAWQHTGDEQFLDASVKLADYYTKHMNDDGIPKWDFTVPENSCSGNFIDTSAAAIAACAFLRLSETLKIKAYRDNADKILKTLITEHSHTFDDDAEILLDKCYCGGFDSDGKRVVNQWSSIFGDYFYMEALLKRSGYNIDMWKLT